MGLHSKTMIKIMTGHDRGFVWLADATMTTTHVDLYVSKEAFCRKEGGAGAD